MNLIQSTMKLKTTYLLLLFALFFATAAEAQVDRRIGTGQYKRSRNKPEKYDFVEESTNYLAKELTLDDFQKAAVKEIIAKEKDEIMAINENTEMNSDVKRDKTLQISDRIYKKVLPLLSKEQAEKYTKMEQAKQKM